MSKDVSKKDETANPVGGTVREIENAGLGSLAWMGPAWIEAMSNIGTEALSFFADRVREDVKTQHELLHCKTVQEVKDVQAKFMERAYTQYTAETGKIIEIGSAHFGKPLAKPKSTPI